MNFIKGFLNFFTTITSCILIMVAVSCSLGDYEAMSDTILWDIIISGALTAIVTAAVYSVEFKSKKHYIFMTAIHYVLLCAVMFFLGVNFGWVDFNAHGVIMMAVDVALVYAMVFAVTYILCKKEADRLNDALEKKYSDK